MDIMQLRMTFLTIAYCYRATEYTYPAIADSLYAVEFSGDAMAVAQSLSASLQPGTWLLKLGISSSRLRRDILYFPSYMIRQASTKTGPRPAYP